MTSRYIPVLSQLLQTKYPQPQNQESIAIQNIRFKIFLPRTSLLLAQYHELKTLSITHCDLRNLQNFPKLYNLQQLDLGFNQLQGTFNNLMPLKRLKYINLQSNIIFELTKLAPLRKIAQLNQQKSSCKLSICVRNNPFVNEDTPYLTKLKNYGLKVVKEPKEYFEKKKQQEEKNTKTSKHQSGKKSLSHQQNQKHTNKAKKPWFQVDPSDDSSLVSELSSIIHPIQPTRPTHLVPSRHHQNQINTERHNYQRISQQRHGLIENIRSSSGRMMVRLGQALDREGRIQVRDIREGFFGSVEPMEELDMGDFGMMVGEDLDDSNSDEGLELFYRSNAPQLERNVDSEMQSRMRMQAHQRRARLQQTREVQLQGRWQRQRLRILELQRQQQRHEIRQQSINQLQEMRRETLQRQRQHRLSANQSNLFMQMYGSSSRVNGSDNVEMGEERNSAILRRQRSLREAYMGRTESIGSIVGAIATETIPRTSGVRRPQGYREYVERRLGVHNNTVSVNEASNSSTNLFQNLTYTTTAPPFRIRASTDSNPNIIRLQRSSVIPGQVIFSASRQHQQQSFLNNQQDQQIESFLNDDGIQDDNDQPVSDQDDDDGQENGLHVCDSYCEDQHGEVEMEEDEDDQPQVAQNPIARRAGVNALQQDADDDDDQEGIEMLFGLRQQERLRQQLENQANSIDRFDFVVNSLADPILQQNNQSNPSSEPSNHNQDSQQSASHQ